VTSRTDRTHEPKRPHTLPASGREPHVLGIPQHLLIACAPFGPRLSAATVARAIARGVQDGGLPEPDVCLLPAPGKDGEDGEYVRRLLDELGFDEHMRRAQAILVGAERLEERTLAGSVTFEIATRARQGGVPAYAITAHNALNAFDARILDLQLILEARSRAALVSAGLKLAGLP
jgi:glycerate kinase